jgi:opacity protein-like surface antigen
MTKILAAAILAALIATPAFAQSIRAGSGDAALRSYAASETQKAKKKKAKRSVVVSYGQPSRSAYSTNPEHDVYVRGEYVGSDPDPRIRWTLREEAKRNYGRRN